MQALVAAEDWSRTAIGDARNWPQSLRTSVDICLASRYPMFVWWGPELTNIYNDAYLPVLGSKHPAGLGQPASEVWAEVWDVIGPLAQGVLERGEASWSEAQLLYLERSGYPEETYFDFGYSPIAGEGGEVAGLLGVVSEITERVLSARRLRTLSEVAARSGAADGVSEVARAAVAALSVNRGDLPFALLYDLGEQPRLLAATGLDPEHEARLRSGSPWPGRAALDRAASVPEGAVIAVPREDLRALAGAGAAAGEQALVLGVEETLGAKPGLALVFGLSPHRRLDGALRQFCTLAGAAVGRAIAGARALEQERERARVLGELDRAKTEFFSNVSHEFRTPLTLLLGPLEQAVAGPDPDPDLEMAHRNALRLLRHVNTLLEFSRLQAQRADPRPRPLDLAAAGRDLADAFRPAIENAGLALRLELAPAPVSVLADPEHLEAIILNLLSNALKFTHEGEIRICVRAEGDHGVLEVADTGIGVPAAEQPRLFERFHRVAGVHARSHEGSGIGLALVRELVEVQGGAISLRSVEGEGSTFTVSLPLSPEAPEEQALPGHPEAFLAEALRWGGELAQSPLARGQEEQAASRRSHERILVVDDNADMRDYLTRLLAPRYEVTTAADGAQALELLRAPGAPDLVLSDVMMPRLDGVGLLQEIRADPALARVPVVLLSARAGEEASVEGLDAGADDYVVKPFSARELLARLAANLELGAMRNREADRAAAHAGRLQELLRREHAITETLQRSMLPEQLDLGAFTQVAARYEPASAAMRVGGDFYDAFLLPNGRSLLVVGDVAGHGVDSAAVMGSMRAALHGYALREGTPGELLGDLNSFAVAMHPGWMTTCQCLIVEADGRTASYATAGHPPGLVRDADGTVHALEHSGGPPLGVRGLVHYPTGKVALGPGSTVLLYTDGLVERRGESLDTGIERVTAGLRDGAPGDPDALARELLAAHRTPRGYEDDVAVLAAVLEEPGPTLDLELDASPPVLFTLRRTLQRWLGSLQLPEAAAYDVMLACHEAAANIVEHAYGLRRGTMRVRVTAVDGHIQLELADNGSWRRERQHEQGRGVLLMRALMDEVEIRSDSEGSTVRMSRALGPR